MPPTDEIGAFYDAHPYPPPVDDLEWSLTGWDEARRRVEHFRHWPTIAYVEERSILVAGCGTSQAARWAARYPEATVVGIDISPSSLEATQRLALRHGLGNLDLRELPIEEAGALDQPFDLIVCTGVIHHLVDPTAGLVALRDVLDSEGALQLMVYATYGRFGIGAIREYARRLGIQPTAKDIAQLIPVLRELPWGHPMSHVLRETADFRDPDALADALLNPRERSYSVPELFDTLDDADLRFARWVRQAPYRPQVGVMRDLPHGEHIALMDEVDQYAAMELFRGTITRHSFIVHRNDAPLPDPLLDWTGEAWQSYIPMLPGTAMVVEDGVPSGKAAAVINQDHVDRDLVCFLTDDELTVLGAIDGKTPLVEIPGATADLLHRLWLHDLVMIDATRRA